MIPQLFAVYDLFSCFNLIHLILNFLLQRKSKLEMYILQLVDLPMGVLLSGT